MKVLLDKRPETRESRAGVTADLDPPRIWTPGQNPLTDMDPRSKSACGKNRRCFLATHELQKVYVAFRGLRDAAGFNWNAPLTAQVKRDSNVV